MAKLVYIISKKTNKTGKRTIGNDGSGSGKGRFDLFHLFSNQKKTPSDEPTEFSFENLLSKFSMSFDGVTSNDSEQRIEFEGSSEEIKELGAWSVSEIKANSDSIKAVGEFVKDYTKSLTNMVSDMYKTCSEADKAAAERNNLEREVNQLKTENENLKFKLEEASKPCSCDAQATQAKAKKAAMSKEEEAAYKAFHEEINK